MFDHACLSNNKVLDTLIESNSQYTSFYGFLLLDLVYIAMLLVS